MRVYQTNNQKVSQLDANKIKDRKTQLADQGSDKIMISQQALNIKELKRDLAKIPAIRIEKVQTFKKQIQSGTYRVSGQAIAKKIFKQDELE